MSRIKDVGQAEEGGPEATAGETHVPPRTRGGDGAEGEKGVQDTALTLRGRGDNLAEDARRCQKVQSPH